MYYELIHMMQTVSWIPIDFAAHTIAEIALSPSQCNVANIVHPYPALWTDVFAHVASLLASSIKRPVELVPYTAWVSKLEQLTTIPTEQDLQSVVGFLPEQLHQVKVLMR